jgi:hypothetical protein
VARGREHGAREQHLFHGADVALGRQQRGQPVAHRLEGGEAHARGDAEQHPVGLAPIAGGEEDRARDDQLARLLDQSDRRRRQRPQLDDGPVFRHAGRSHTQRPADHEALQQ